MKSKTSLTLIEQMIMLLVLAAVSAVCLRIFAYSDSVSRSYYARDSACRQAQSAAETLKAFAGDFAAAADSLGGDWDGSSWIIGFNARWEQTGEPPRYVLAAEKLDSGTEYLGRARICVSEGETELFSVEVCWQEEGA